MSEVELTDEIISSLDHITALAERNGWNAAINACRKALPPDQSFKLRHLYKLEEPVTPTSKSAVSQ
jgi:hypothetical protein